jgi:hypothetical protein
MRRRAAGGGTHDLAAAGARSILGTGRKEPKVCIKLQCNAPPNSPSIYLPGVN